MRNCLGADYRRIQVACLLYKYAVDDVTIYEGLLYFLLFKFSFSLISAYYYVVIKLGQCTMCCCTCFRTSGDCL